METRRRFSKAFKRQVVEEYLSGSVTQAQLGRASGYGPEGWGGRPAAGWFVRAYVLIPRWLTIVATGDFFLR
ncbi:MAG: transposase [Candidatus Neomarinimicrobiota bacterium]